MSALKLTPKLTKGPDGAHKGPMRGQRRSLAGLAKGMMVIAGAVQLGGCISLEAPDQPIVIELNINITQEVIYRLAEDAGNAIDENADIF